MARSTKDVDLGRRQPLGILNRSCAGRSGVRAPGSVASLAMDTGLARLHLKLRLECDRSGRVTTETAESRCDRVENPIRQIAGILVTGSDSQRFGCAVITHAVFRDAFLVRLAHPSNCFGACAESPLRSGTGPGIRRLCPPQGACMCCFRLRFELGAMATAAGRTSDIVRSNILASKRQNAGGKYQISAHMHELEHQPQR